MAGPEAIALLRIRIKRLSKKLRAQEEPTDGVKLFATENGQLLGLSELKDGTAVHTFLPFFSSADELSLGLGQLLGDALADHDDPRGVFIAPDHRLPDAKKYDTFIAKAESDGLWVPVAAPARVSDAIARRTEQVVEFMAQMTALNQAAAAGDARSVAKAKKALLKAFNVAESKSVRTSHPIATKVRRGGKKALASLQSAFEGVKLDDVRLPAQWQKAADAARKIIQKEVNAVTGKKRRVTKPRSR